MVNADFEQQIAGVASLNDPVRRALYQFVSSSSEAVGRDEAAKAVGIQRGLAAFHLDKLADEGLLLFEFRRRTGRVGPGAGRPAKLYRRSDIQIELSLPQREYNLAGMLLAEAIDAAERTGRPVREEVERAAFAFGRTMGEVAREQFDNGEAASQTDAVVDVLKEHGFEPHQEGEDIVLSNCPFHELAQQYTDLVCGMNLGLLQGVRSVLTVDGDSLQPRLAPEPGRCCVRFCGREA